MNSKTDSNIIRDKFFDFFKKNGHTQVASSSLIPAQDPTLLFTNAGMNQFKDLFLGLETRSYTRAVSIQKCMRAGGKHNDLDNVGFTARHLTFFEMMGNFSFGDYFKKEAIEFAWNFLTKEVNLPEEKLHATVFLEDDESYDIWHKVIGLPKERITRLGAKDNFWQMGDVGPCGPCTEIYIDRGLEHGPKDAKPGDDSERFLEIWNLVFMQFDRQPNGEDLKLKKPGVDTGMGLERLLMVLEGKNSVYETSLFQEIIQNIEKLTGKKYQDKLKPAFNVLADHIRSSTFLLADGCTPSNEGRGYVLRKIIRRAALFEQKLTNKSIFPDLAKSVISSMSNVYPELKENQDYIVSVLKSEVEKFASNLIRGRNLIAKMFSETKNKNLITGEETFRLYDTFGFPTELIELVAQEYNSKVDLDGFAKEMEKQKLQSGKKIKHSDQINLPDDLVTNFTGYKELETSSEIIAIIHDNKVVDQLETNQTGWLITKESPFFVECGGQVNDHGYIEFKDSKSNLEDLKKIHNCIAMQITTKINLKVKDKVKMVVDKDTRLNTMKNHTATHLLQAALKELLGNQVKQSGSIVTPDYLRFDFTYHENLTPEQINWLENKVNQKIMANIPLNIYETTYNKAVKDGVTAIFGEKYNPENVRVIDIPEFSAELCGGTHVNRTGDIGVFKITESTALSAGNRRIVALTGPAALSLFQQEFTDIKQLSQHFKVQPNLVIEAVDKQSKELKKAQSNINLLKKELLNFQIPEICNTKKTIQSIPIVTHEFSDADMPTLQTAAQTIAKTINGIALVYSNSPDKSSFALIADNGLKINLEAIKIVLQDHGIKSGGKNNSLQGGGTIINQNLIDNLLKAL